MLSGPIIYSLHFVAVYLLVEAACRVDGLRFEVLGLDGIAFWVVVLTLVAVLVTAYSGLVAYRNWQQLGGPEDRRFEDSATLMAFAGVWLNGMFAVLILLTGLPALFLVVCDWI
jgi:hypothetical protein